jgi:uncharacterized protein YegL
MSAAGTGVTFSTLPMDPQLRRALIACSLALNLDDPTALAAIRTVIAQEEIARTMLWSIKSSGWVWDRSDGTWMLRDQVRREAASASDAELGQMTTAEIRSLMIQAADRKCSNIDDTSHLGAHAAFRACFEAALLRIQSDKDAQAGDHALFELWLKARPSARLAVSQSVEALIGGFVPTPTTAVTMLMRGYAALERHGTRESVRFFDAAAALARDARLAAVALVEYARLIASDNFEAARTALARSSKLWTDDAHQAEVANVEKYLKTCSRQTISEHTPVNERQMALMIDQRCACMFALDTSASMSGKGILQLNQSLAVLERELKNNRVAAGRVEVGITTFGAGGVQMIQDFVPAKYFTAPELRAGDGTPMGGAIRLALNAIRTRIEQYRSLDIDYYRPWLVVITDGEPTDEGWEEAVADLQREQDANRLNCISVGVGSHVNIKTLKQISERRAARLKDLGFENLFVWLSGTLAEVSTSASEQEIELPTTSSWGQLEV